MNSNTSTYANTVRKNNHTVPKPFPSRNQAILLPADEKTPLINYIVAVGRLVGPQNVLSASKISKKRICMYLISEEITNQLTLHHKFIEVNDSRIPIHKLITPSKKIVLSNVHSCIPNSLIIDAFHQYNIKTTSAIHELHVGTSSNEIPKEELAKYSHVQSFRRGVFIEINPEVPIPESIVIHFENEAHRIFLNDPEIRCYICKSIEHNAHQCDQLSPSVPPQNEYSTSQTLPSSDDDKSFTDCLGEARKIRALKNSQDPNTAPLPIPPVNKPTTDQQSNKFSESQEVHKQPSSNKRSLWWESNAESTASSDSRPLRKVSKQTPVNDNPLNDNVRLSQEDSEAVIKLLEEDPPSKGINPNDVIEFLTEMLTTNSNDLMSKVKGYPTDVTNFTTSILLTRTVIKDKRLKNRLTRFKKKLSPTSNKSSITNSPNISDSDNDEVSKNHPSQ